MRFCRLCFCRWIEARFHRLIRKEKLIRGGDRILVGLSGGKDSQLLISLLDRIRAALPCELVGLTVDEGISGYRDAGIQIARATADCLGITHTVISFSRAYGMTLDEMVQRASNTGRLAEDRRWICTLCGTPRMRLLVDMASQLNCAVVASGRNLDDFVADALVYMCVPFNAMKIAGLRSSTYDRYGDVRIVNPLCRFSDKEIALYAQLQQIPYQLEPECPYSGYNLSDTMRAQVHAMEERVPGFRHCFSSGMRFIQTQLDMRCSTEAQTACLRCGRVLLVAEPGEICLRCMHTEFIETLGGHAVRLTDLKEIAEGNQPASIHQSLGQ